MTLWKWWIVVVAVVSGPWFGVTSRPQWDRAAWIPFRGKEDKPSDMALNLLLFVPFGWSYMSGQPKSWRRLAATIGAGALVSFGAEASQLFFLRRDPSATDIVIGICGTVVGASASTVWRCAVGIRTQHLKGAQNTCGPGRLSRRDNPGRRGTGVG